MKQIQPDYLAHFPRISRGHGTMHPAQRFKYGIPVRAATLCVAGCKTSDTCEASRELNAHDWEESVKYTGPDFRGTRSNPPTSRRRKN